MRNRGANCVLAGKWDRAWRILAGKKELVPRLFFADCVAGSKEGKVFALGTLQSDETG